MQIVHASDGFDRSFGCRFVQSKFQEEDTGVSGAFRCRLTGFQLTCGDEEGGYAWDAVCLERIRSVYSIGQVRQAGLLGREPRPLKTHKGSEIPVQQVSLRSTGRLPRSCYEGFSGLRGRISALSSWLFGSEGCEQ